MNTNSAFFFSDSFFLLLLFFHFCCCCQPWLFFIYLFAFCSVQDLMWHHYFCIQFCTKQGGNIVPSIYFGKKDRENLLAQSPATDLQESHTSQVIFLVECVKDKPPNFSVSVIQRSQTQTPPRKKTWQEQKQQSSLRFICTSVFSFCNMYCIHNSRHGDTSCEREDCSKQCISEFVLFVITFPILLIQGSYLALANLYRTHTRNIGYAWGEIVTSHKLFFLWERFILKPCSRMKILPRSQKFKQRKKTQDLTSVSYAHRPARKYNLECAILQDHLFAINKAHLLYWHNWGRNANIPHNLFFLPLISIA